MILRRAREARACFAGSAFESARGFASAITTIRTSACSAVHSAGGWTQSSCSSEASSKKAAWASSVVSCMTGSPPGRLPLAVAEPEDQQRHDDGASADPEQPAERAADSCDDREPREPGRHPEAYYGQCPRPRQRRCARASDR